MKTEKDTFIYQQNIFIDARNALYESIIKLFHIDDLANKLAEIVSKPEEPHADR